MKTKKLTIAASAVSVAVLMAVVLVFATSAKADNSTNEIETAKKRLTVYYSDSDSEMHDLTMPDGTSYEWDMDSVKEINVNGIKGYSFEMRWTSDEEKNGQMAGRLAGIYGVSKDGLHYYDDTDGDKIWEEFPAAKRIFPVAPDAGKDYPVCGIIRDMTEDTLTVEVVEFITRDDTDRIRELGLTEESNMPDGYHINMDNSKRVTWKLTDWTSYIFIDWGGDFTGDQEPGGGYCITMDRSIFEEYLSGYPSFEEMKMPFFFRVEDDAVTGIFEYPFM